MDNLTLDSGLILIILSVVTLILFLMIIVLWVKMNRMRKKYVQMLNGVHAENVEHLLIEMQTAINRLSQDSQEHDKMLKFIWETMRSMKSRVGVYRYNAFAERGSDLSFSVAILNEYQDGVVITGIHNREDTYIYAKPITKGESNYTLSPEEKEAISRSS